MGGSRGKAGRAGGGRRSLQVVFGVWGRARGLNVGGVGLRLRPD